MWVSVASLDLQDVASELFELRGFRSVSGWEGGECTPQRVLYENKILDLPKSWQ